MKHLILISLFFLPLWLAAQGPIDGYFKGKGNTDVALTYSSESYEFYYFGKSKLLQPNQVQSGNLFIAHGAKEGLDVILSVPYLYTDTINRGFQDGILAIKYKNGEQKLETSTVSLLSSFAISTPISNYPTDTDRPIGAKTTSGQFRLLGQVYWNNGVFTHLKTGFDFRVIPSSLVSIPTVWRIGYGGSKIYVDAWMEYFHTFNGGVDTTIAGGNGSIWLKTGGTFYYSITPNFGAFIGGAYYLTGQNIGQAGRWNAGLVYKFTKKEKKQ